MFSTFWAWGHTSQCKKPCRTSASDKGLLSEMPRQQCWCVTAVQMKRRAALQTSNSVRVTSTRDPRFSNLWMLSLIVTIRLKYPLFSSVLWSLQEVRVHAFWQGLWSLSVTGFVSFTVFSSVCPRFQVKGQWLYSPQLQRSVGVCSPAASFEQWSPPLKLWWSDEKTKHWGWGIF